jgi:hypothetical protein
LLLKLFWHTYSDYKLLCLPEIGLTTGWQVDRGCLLLLGTWCHLWFVQGSVFAQSSGFVFYTGFMRLITVRYINLSYGSHQATCLNYHLTLWSLFQQYWCEVIIFDPIDLIDLEFISCKSICILLTLYSHVKFVLYFDYFTCV